MEAALSGDPRSHGSARRTGWSLAAAIACVTVFACSIGVTTPLLALILDERGVVPGLIGLNAAAAFVGVGLGSLLTPRLVRRFGVRALLLGCLSCDALLFPLLKLADSLGAWFVLCILMGCCGSALFTTTEAWISRLAGDRGRGRVMGLYAAFLSAGFAIGPVLLSLTGIHGWSPFLVDVALAALAAVPVLCSRDPEGMRGVSAMSGPLAMFRGAPDIMLVVALFGVFEAALMSLLPVWGTRRGLDPQAAARCLSVLYVGAIGMQVPIGWCSDRLGRRATLILCSLAGIAGAVGIALVPVRGWVLDAVLFFWGGLAGGLYPVALSMAGDRFRDPGELMAANAALILAYGLGSLVGAPLGGAALEWWSPNGLPAFLVLVFVAALAARLVPAGAP